MLTFDVTNATLKEEFGGSVSIWDGIEDKPMEPISKPECKTFLSLHVKLGEDERVTLSTGERLKNLGGFVTIYPQTENFQEGSKGIGVMSYSEEVPDYSIPAKYYIKVLLPPPQFADLVAAARLGRIPSKITINERGMKLPDEFSKEWDNKSSPHLHVSSISLSIPLAVGETNQEKEGSPQAPFLPPTQLQILHLEHSMRMFGQVMQNINTKLKWLLVLISALGAIALVFKL